MLWAFESFKKACLKAPVLAFANFNKPFLLKTDASLVAYASWSLTVHEYTYHLTKQEFWALKWTIVEQFQEYLPWKPFIVKIDNNHTHLDHDYTQFIH